MFISSSRRLTKRNNGVVEQGTEQSGSLRVDAAQLQGEEHGGDGREVPGQYKKAVKSIKRYPDKKDSSMKEGYK